MKKWIYSVIITVCMGNTPVLAQQNIEQDGLEFPHKVITNGFWNNWFFGAGGGINIYAGEHDQHLSLGNRLAPALNAYAGKWFTPGIAVRAAYSGLYWKGEH